MTSMPPIWDRFESLIPVKPYCADSLGEGLLIRSRVYALQYKYIQVNAPLAIQWLPFDVDLADAYDAFERSMLPAPNVFIANPVNGHAHLLWALNVPVALVGNARREPIKFAAAVERGMGRRLQADTRYAGLIVKNPRHKHWRTRWMVSKPYSLIDLADHLTPGDMRFKPRGSAEMGFVGRNVHVFNETRDAAYREVRTFKRNGQTFEAFQRWVENAARQVNMQFPCPLSFGEIKGIAKSVAKWTWANFSAERFSAIQSSRGVRSGVVRQAKTKRVQEVIAEYCRHHAPGLLSDMVRGRPPLKGVGPAMSSTAIGERLGIPARTLRRHLNALRRSKG